MLFIINLPNLIWRNEHRWMCSVQIENKNFPPLLWHKRLPIVRLAFRECAVSPTGLNEGAE